jgi:3-oxoacyl-[acyl-carrier-protein] synthase-3
MRYENVCIEAIGYELPPNVVTSAAIEERLTPLYDRLKLPHGRLELMSGIRERRFWNKGESPSSAAIRAGKKAIEMAGVDPAAIGAIFHAAVCRDFLEPATASVEHYKLGVSERAMVFDISNACLGVLDGMIMVANMIELGQIETGIIVSGEMGESLVNTTIDALNANLSLTRKTVKGSFASLTIGSGAVAVVLTHRKLSKTGHRLLGGVTRAATIHSTLCTSDQDAGFSGGATPLMETDAEELLRAGCALAAETWVDFKTELGWNETTATTTITHQVGVAHRKLLYESIGVDVARDFPTLEFLGNVGSVSLPITLGMAVEQGAVNKGEKSALLGIGSGLNCMMLGVEW